MAAPGVSIQVVGLKSLVDELRTAGKALPREMSKTNRSVVQDIVVPAAKVEVPVRSGDLQRSIRAGGRQTEGRVVAGKAAVPYAGVIHFGSAEMGISPNPFLYRALDSRRDEVLKAYQVAVNKLLKRVL